MSLQNHTEFARRDTARTPWLSRFTPVLVFTGVCWLMFVINNLLLDGRWSQHGIVPRHLSGLPGILWAPFLHNSFAHLVANTVPLLVLGTIIAGRGKAEFVGVTAAGVLLSGGLTWVVARTGSHAGASGLIFCFFGYLTSLAYFRKTFGSLLVAILCLLAYGGMLRGIVPTSNAVSWEGHAAGLVSGVVLAWMGTRLKETPRP